MSIRLALQELVEVLRHPSAPTPQDPPAFRHGSPWPPPGWLTVDEAIALGQAKPWRGSRARSRKARNRSPEAKEIADGLPRTIGHSEAT